MAASTWKPDQPLPNADDEKEANERAQGQARVEYLKQKYLNPDEPKKKRRGPFGD